MSQGNSLYIYLKQRKMFCFVFFFYKIREQEDRTGLVWKETWYQREGGRCGERV
jgi:hypothetical protein